MEGVTHLPSSRPSFVTLGPKSAPFAMFAMSLRSCGNITVKGNTFKLTNPRRVELPERGAIEIEKSSGIRLLDNTVVKTPYYRGPLTRNRYPHANKGIIRCTLDREPLTIYTDSLDAYTVEGTKLVKE